MEAAAAVGLRRAARPAVPDGPYLVAGLARAGRAAVELLAELAGADAVAGWDSTDHKAMRKVAGDLEAAGVRCRLGGDGVAVLADSGARCVVKSPGIPPDAALVRAAERAGVLVIDELELAWRSSPLPMVGITGTKGKSTVTTMVAAVCRAAAGAGHMAGNTDFAPAWSALPRDASGIAACEVSSGQIEGCRELLPDVAVLTNLHPETNRHGSLEATAAIKQRLFVRGERCVPVAVLNADDAYGREFAQLVRERGGRVLTYGRDASADYRVGSVEWTLDGSTAELDTPDGPVRLRTRAPGLQNAVNGAAAVAVGEAIGLSVERAAAAVATADPPPGRFDRVDEGQPFDFLVDMAHTPSSIRECLSTLRAVVDRRPGASLRAIVGIVGSNAMAEPREATGRVARELADELIVAGSALRGEPPLVNMASVLKGAREVEGGELRAVLDRRAAIGLAIASARPGDIIVAFGRGPLAEMSFDAHGGGVHASDAQIATAALRSLRAT